jgi:hypothetical protein
MPSEILAVSGHWTVPEIATNSPESGSKVQPAGEPSVYEIVPSEAPAESVAVTVVDSEYFKVLTAGVSENVRAALLIVTVAVAVSAK